jgi:hypothetical protein
MVADLHLHEYQEHFYRVDDLADTKDLGGYQKDLWLYRMLIQT